MEHGLLRWITRLLVRFAALTSTLLATPCGIESPSRHLCPVLPDLTEIPTC